MDWNGRSKKYNPRWKSATACREGDPVNSENTLPDEEGGGEQSAHSLFLCLWGLTACTPYHHVEGGQGSRTPCSHITKNPGDTEEAA